MTKKNNITIALVVIIILAVIAIIALKNRSQKTEVELPLTQADKDFNKAVVADTTTDINASLKNIDVNDTTGDADLKSVDQELLKL
jgi:serine protease inhibitor ecotin